MLVGDVLNVAAQDFDAKLLHVLAGLGHNLVGKGIAVGVDGLEVEGANDLAHVALEGVLQACGNGRVVHVKEVALGKQHALGVVGNANLGNGINANVDKVVGGNKLVGFDVYRDLLEAKSVDALEKRHLKAGATDEDARLGVHAGYDESLVWRGLDVAREYEQSQEGHGRNNGDEYGER